MERREDELSANGKVAGIGIKRNPGVTLLWTTDKWTPFKDSNGGTLIRIGDPDATEWWSHGRAAKRDEVLESVRTGIPLLEEAARRDCAAAVADLAEQQKEAEKYYPAR